MLLLEDMNQKLGHHEAKNEYFINNGWRALRVRLPFGDYMIVDEDELEERGKRGIDVHFTFGWRSFTPHVSVDTKADIAELAADLINDHKRFRSECVAAHEHDCNLIIMIETTEVSSIAELAEWKERKADFIKRNGKERRDGAKLAKVMHAMNAKYGVRFDFIPPDKAGERVIYLLEKGETWAKAQQRLP